jgi:hypothetical protein
MSQFDADPFLQQLAAGVGNLEVARRNFETKANVGLQGQALRQQAESEANRAQMQQTELAAQAQMQQQAQAAQSADYAQLNASRERMAQQEMAQQQGQFEQSQAQSKELMMMQNRTSVRLQQIEAEKRKVDAQILASSRNDPRLVEMRNQRKALDAQARNLEMAMNSTMAAHQLATTTKEERGTEVMGKLQSFQSAMMTQRTGAEDAMTRAIDDAFLDVTRGNGFWGQMGRVQMAQGVPVTTGLGLFTAGGEILLENLGESILGISNPEDYRERLSDSTKSPLAMTAAIMERALDNHSDGLGMKAGQKDVVKAAMMKVLAGGARLGRSEDWTGDLNQQQQDAIKGEIAAGLGQLRQAGMSDAQIMGMLESVEGLAENRTQTFARLGTSGADGALSEVLGETLTGVGRIIDAVQAVGDDSKLMGGQKIVDHSKFDLGGAYRNAMAAYATAEGSQQLGALRQQLTGYGMGDQELLGVIEALTRAEPELQNLDPRVILQMLKAQQAQAGELGARGAALGEEERLRQEQILGQGGMAASDIETQRLESLLSEMEGGQ